MYRPHLLRVETWFAGCGENQGLIFWKSVVLITATRPSGSKSPAYWMPHRIRSITGGGQKE
jgi:hypothetical protein